VTKTIIAFAFRKWGKWTVKDRANRQIGHLLWQSASFNLVTSFGLNKSRYQTPVKIYKRW